MTARPAVAVRGPDSRRRSSTTRSGPASSAALRTNLSPRHVPDLIEAVPAVPRTLSGKKLEVPVKRILSGVGVERAAAKGALANPEALEWFERWAEPGDEGQGAEGLGPAPG